MEKYNFENLRVFQLSEKLANDIWDIVISWNHLATDTVGKQIIRSADSIGANIAEANGAISKADFSAKISIAYKECLETKFWLNLLKDTNYISSKEFNSIYPDADEISKMLFSILKSSRLTK